jgi:spoIIIJ-associated protein
MRSVEIEGDTIDEAIARALRALGVERDRVEIDILTDAARGMFGLRRRKARIRATVRAPLLATLDGCPSPSPDVPQETRDSGDVGASGPRVLEARGNREGNAPIGGHEKATTTVEVILRGLGAPGRVSVTRGEEPGTTLLEIATEEASSVIGRKGETLDAIEYLVNRIVARDDGSRRERYVLDVEGYRGRRLRSLEELAHRLADTVRATGRPATVPPMSPRDRRILHLALRGESGVESRTRGQGYYRKLVVVPARRPPVPEGGVLPD